MSKIGDPNKDIQLLKEEIKSISHALEFERVFKVGLEGAIVNSQKQIKHYCIIIARKEKQIKSIQDYIKETRNENRV